MKPVYILLFFTLSMVSALQAQFPEPDGGDLEPGVLPRTWLTGGPKCMESPEWQVHEYNANLYILRQSGCTDTEMPFLYLFFGKDRGLLWDTGSRNGNLVPTLQRVVHNWLDRNHRTSIPLVVMHSHSHGDHTAGDKDIKALVDPAIPITFVPATVPDTKAFFHIDSWPDGVGAVDLGERNLKIIPLPGHDVVSIALYDHQTGILLTGDSLYPGRIYISDFPAFEASTERLIAFVADKPVAHILGNHIEQTRTPFKDFPIGSIYHPNEHSLDLSFGSLLELENGLKLMQSAPRRFATRDFTIWPHDPKERGLGQKMAELRKRTQEDQLKNKWSQPQ